MILRYESPVCSISFRALILFLFLTCADTGKAQNSERWEKAIVAFESQDRKSPPSVGGVLFIGSSSIRKWDSLSEDFPNKNVINRGFGGSKIPDSIHFFERIVQPYKPSVIVLYAGDNDIGGGHTAQQVFDNFKVFSNLVAMRLPEAKLVFIAIKPSVKRWRLAPEMLEANREIEKYSKRQPHISYANIWNPMLSDEGKPRPELFIADGLHLNAEGYKIWARVVNEKL
ncbi:SGNH/GDSL hydrolase family protein [Verrucomicrobia bacterium]|jgi:lysophospholipase L1-like esterase|nr:SGNH/GDSL hydrolase family protein [Verrucomicrobiota bacterium]